MKRFTCDAGTFEMDQVINGQTNLLYNDTLGQIASNPDLRLDTIMCFDATGIEGLVSQLQSLTKSDKRMVKTNPYYWTEVCHDTTIITTILKVNTPGTAGATIQATVDPSSHSRNGQFSVTAGHRGYIKELNGQGVNITAISRSVNKAHVLTLEPLNGESIDLSKLPYYTLLIDPMRLYLKGDTSCIVTEGFVGSLPTLRKGYLQKFEKGYSIHDDELTGYAYDREFKLYKALVDNKPVTTWGFPEINRKLLVDWMDSRVVNMLFGRRDDVRQQGFDGLIPTAEGQGAFTRLYDPADGVSLKTILFNMIKSLRKVNGPTEYMMLYDFGFQMDWSEAMAALVKAMAVPGDGYQLFGAGGEGARDFKYFQFKDFEAYNYRFRGYLVNAMDSQRYGGFLEDFCILMPAVEYKDIAGNTVPPVTLVNIGAAEDSPQGKIWKDDTRERGCRVVNIYAQDTFGMEIHCASKLGVWRKAAC